MRITIAERLRPFSHRAGSRCLIPGSGVAVEVYPTYLRFTDCRLAESSVLADMELPLTGPVRDFTVQLDLEAACVKVWGQAQQGFFRYRLAADTGAVKLAVDKGEGLQDWSLSTEAAQAAVPATRLSLASHKKQDVELAARRGDLATILPCLLRQGALIPEIKPAPAPYEGTLALLEPCRAQFGERPEALHRSLETWFTAGFEGIICPRLVDSDYHGVRPFGEKPGAAFSPLQLLQEGAKLIQALFIQSTPEGLVILPSLPPEFHAGRFTDVDCGPWGTVSLEWSKKRPRRLILDAAQSGELVLTLRQDSKSFRLRTSKEDRGIRCDASKPIRVEAGQRYYLDRIER